MVRLFFFFARQMVRHLYGFIGQTVRIDSLELILRCFWKVSQISSFHVQQMNMDLSVADGHLCNMGKMIEELEGKLRNSLDQVFWGIQYRCYFRLSSPREWCGISLWKLLLYWWLRDWIIDLCPLFPLTFKISVNYEGLKLEVWLSLVNAGVFWEDKRDGLHIAPASWTCASETARQLMNIHLCSENLYLFCVSCYWTSIRFYVRLVRVFSWKAVLCDYAGFCFFRVEWLCNRTLSCISFNKVVDRLTTVFGTFYQWRMLLKSTGAKLQNLLPSAQVLGTSLFSQFTLTFL